MIHACAMAIVPIDLNGIASDELDPSGSDAQLHLFAANDSGSGMLVHAAGARAKEAQLRVRHCVFFGVAEGQQDLQVIQRLNTRGARGLRHKGVLG